ncbi:exodeoxyribonuclease VII small subunit [Hankyongella ginsenosidimutans]|uniref:Exodeoxyribonuclease 7 small subunit n=1 Tax=Hankyongella ginsenosidimutans TaxID=1763828 RepID=A0A4D7C7L6_9SPHN|nr:exodeoxyribonuclease VII small subunit [Hankyongella ginsenosidimutans]QCI79258.1 exodeoxyribonuclease VII small subunit [Hankyongella ginsenosidimutans]
MTDQDLQDQIRTLSFEQAIERLEAIVGQLEQGRAGLEQSIALFAEGSELKRHCAAKLADAQMRIERLQIDADGQPRGSAPLSRTPHDRARTRP